MGKPGEKHSWWCYVCETRQPLAGGIRPNNAEFVCATCATPELRDRLKRAKSWAVRNAIREAARASSEARRT